MWVKARFKVELVLGLVFGLCGSLEYVQPKCEFDPVAG